MKKLVSVLLAVLMVFSVVTVAFAAEDETPQEPATQETTNELFSTLVTLLIGDGSIENVPLGTAKAAFKIAKIIFKLAKAFIKVGDALGFIDGDKIVRDLAEQIVGMLINNGDAETPAPADPAPATP